MFESGEEVTREGSIALLERGCSDIQRTIVKQGIHKFVSFEEMQYDRQDSIFFDLRRFCIDMSGEYSGLSVRKTLAGLVVGAEIALCAGALHSELGDELQIMTIGDYSINDRITKFESLVADESIEPLEEFIPMPDDLMFHGKNYFMGVKAMLAAGFRILNNPYADLRVMLAEEWFAEASKVFSDPNSPLLVPDY